MEKKYRNLLDLLEPYVVCAQPPEKWVGKDCLGKKLGQDHFYNPLSLKSQSFIERIYKLDAITFGDQGMGMDKWVFFDCSVMPGFVFGYSIKGDKLNELDRKKLGIGANDYFPVSMYIAIPTMDEGIWFGHNLSSLNRHLSFSLSGLGVLTKLAGLQFFEIETLRGATQWFSPALFIHTKISRLKLLSAYTPIHSKAETLCYECSVPKNLNALEKISKNVEVEGEFLFNTRKENLIKLQQKIDQGETFSISRVKSLNEIYLI